jgi:hypothetical protein
MTKRVNRYGLFAKNALVGLGVSIGGSTLLSAVSAAFGCITNISIAGTMLEKTKA